MKAKAKAPAPGAGEPKPDDCVALVGGMLCGLCMVREIKDVREAVQWWARNQKGWTHFAAFQAREKAAGK